MSYLETITEYGSRILQSREFAQIMTQKHHGVSTAGIHSLRVAYFCLLIASVLGVLGMTLDRKALVRIALCHDLGMAGRKERYHTGHDCCFLHPVNSALEARQILPDITYRETDAIETHMFPLSTSHPHSKEGWVLTVADKMAAITDFCIVFRKPAWIRQMERTNALA